MMEVSRVQSLNTLGLIPVNPAGTMMLTTWSLLPRIPVTFLGPHPNIADWWVVFSFLKVVRSSLGHPLNTPLSPPGSTVVTSLRSKAISVMRINKLRECFKVVACQLARLRMLLTAHVIKTAVIPGTVGPKVTKVRAKQSLNALLQFVDDLRKQ